jgi:hypothetical protein
MRVQCECLLNRQYACLPRPRRRDAIGLMRSHWSKTFVVFSSHCIGVASKQIDTSTTGRMRDSRRAETPAGGHGRTLQGATAVD